MNGLCKRLMSLAVLIPCCIALHAATPKGWFVAGSEPAEYESGIDVSAVHNYRPSGYLKAKTPIIQGFGTLMQEFKADHYLGKRICFSARVKTADAQDWAGLWMRVDKGPKMLAFDNMQDRPIKGASNWQRYAVVLEVPGRDGDFLWRSADGFRRGLAQ